MTVDDPNLTQARGSATGAARARETRQTTESHDDMHLSELIRSLRALAAESPERQARIESIARTHAQGQYRVDAEATAAHIIGDALTVTSENLG